jgi:NADPH-dependent 2,4-dienoyl-CoA reductase/sulfur reductase-like enzyme/nitrite reductase/ring-hydroxylating ferredoxin subunit
MAETRVLSIEDLPLGAKKVVKVGTTEILLIHHEHGLAAVQPKCPHAGAPLEEGAVCGGRLVCPWHLGTFSLPGGELLEPPPLEPLKTYPVRLQDGGIFVNPDPYPTKVQTEQSSDRSVFVLVGLGAAGVAAAATLRQSDYRGTIVAIDPVPEEPVDRTQLSKDALGGKMPLDKVGLDGLDNLDVERILASVTKLSAATRTVNLSNGNTLNFDKALVATGGKPKRLSIPGAELAYTIRHPADVWQILQAAKGSKKTVIIGTSFIGLEAASALVQSGLQVTVVGKEELPFGKQFGQPVARALKSLHEKNGVKFRLGVEILNISRGAVTIREGSTEEQISMELAIMGVGVSPDLDFEHDLPVDEKSGGIKTDSSLAVAPGVWVAGDIASVNGSRIEHWRVAQQHGRLAALAMTGTKPQYEGVPYFWTYHFSKRLGYLGQAEKWDQTFVKGNIDKFEFIVFYINGGRVEAVLNCEFETQMAALAELMRSKPTLDEALRAIAE